MHNFVPLAVSKLCFKKPQNELT